MKPALLRSLPWGFNRGKVWNGVVVSRYIIQDKGAFDFPVHLASNPALT